MYASKGDTIPELLKYRKGDQSDEESIPQVKQVNTQVGGFAANVTDDRFVYYLIIPVNDEGEAGPHAYGGAKVIGGSDSKLPELLLKTTPPTKEVVVYKTALMDEDGAGKPLPGANGFYKLGRFSAVRGSQNNNFQEVYARPPDEKHEFELDDDPDNGTDAYADRTVDYIYFASSYWEVGGPDPDPQIDILDPTNLVGWELELEWETDTQDTLSTGTRYVIDSVSTDPETGNVRAHIVDTNGNQVSFDGNDVIELADFDLSDSNTDFQAFYGVKIVLYTPSSTILGDNTVLIRDDEDWRMDFDSNGEQANAPTGDSLDRPQNVHSAKNVDASIDTNDRPRTTQDGFRTARFDSLYYGGGLLYGGHPRWPLDTPQAAYLETDANEGETIKIQSEYSANGESYYGPALEIPDVTKVACPWQGVEDAIHVFITGQLDFDITNIAYVEQDHLGSTNPFDTTIEVSPDGTNSDSASESTNTTSSRLYVRFDYVIDTNSTDADNTVSAEPGATVTLDVTDTTNNTSSSDSASISGVDKHEEGTLTVTVDDVAKSSDISVDITREVSANGGQQKDSNGNLSMIGSSAEMSAPSGYDEVEEYALETDITVDDPNNAGSDPEDGILTIDQSNKNNGEYTLFSASHNSNNGKTTYRVDDAVPDDSDTSGVAVIEGQFQHYRRLVPSIYGGAYLTDDATTGKSTFIFDADSFTRDDFIETTESRATVKYVTESDKVFFSNTNRPLEMTFSQFETPGGSVVRGIWRARLAEEEGLRAYNFYVGTEKGIFVINPDVTNRTMSLQAVTTAFGIALGPTKKPIRTLITQGAVIYGTDGLLHILSGRQEQAVVPRGSEPWDDVRGLAFLPRQEYIYISTDTGLWAFDLQRQGIVAQYDLNATTVLYDRARDEIITYDQDSNTWKVLDERNDTLLAASVQTQPITHGAMEGEVKSVVVDYDEIDAGASYPAPSEYASITQTRRYSGDSVTMKAPRGYKVHPQLRGEGMQLRVESFDVLHGMITHVTNTSE